MPLWVCYNTQKAQTNPSEELILEEIIPNTHQNQEVGDIPLEEGGNMEIELDERELAGVDLVNLEKYYQRKELYTIPPYQLRTVHKVYMDSTVGETSRATKSLGIHKEPLKDTHNKAKEEKRCGCKSTQQLKQKVGRFMVNYGQIQLISDSFLPCTTLSSS